MSKNLTHNLRLVLHTQKCAGLSYAMQNVALFIVGVQMNDPKTFLDIHKHDDHRCYKSIGAMNKANLKLVFYDACRRGRHKIMLHLVENMGINPCMDNNKALKEACMAGDIETVKFMCTSLHIDPSVNNNVAVICGIMSENVELVKYICSLPSIDLTGKDNYVHSYFVRISQVDMSNFLSTLLPGIEDVHNVWITT